MAGKQQRHKRRRSIAIASHACLGLAALGLAGCHSAFINTEVINHSGGQVTLLEVDYPSASFGRDTVPADARFNYRFKIIGSGPVSASWTDAAGHQHTATGPALHEGQEGPLQLVLLPETAQWTAHLAH
jgi:hypothetical protein